MLCVREPTVVMSGVSLRLSSDCGTRPTRRRSEGGTRSGSAAVAGGGAGSSTTSSARARLAPVMKASTSSRRERLTLSGLNRSLSADCMHMGDVVSSDGSPARPAVGSGIAELLRQRGGEAGGSASGWPDNEMCAGLGLLPSRRSSRGDSSASMLRPGLRWCMRWCSRSIE